MKNTRALGQRRQERGHVALALERRAGGLDERDVELGGDDLGQGRLAEAGWPGEQDVVERLPARRGGLDGDRELARRPSWPTKSSSVRGRSELSRSSSRPWRTASGSGRPRRRRRHARPCPRSPAGRAQSFWLGSSAVSPCGGREQLAGLGEREAKLEQALAGERASGRPGRPRPAGRGEVRRRRDDALAQLDDDPLGRLALADPGDGAKPVVSPAASAATSSRGGPPERTASATLGPTVCTPSSSRNSSRSSSEANP